jgi:hypothetical protein
MMLRAFPLCYLLLNLGLLRQGLGRFMLPRHKFNLFYRRVLLPRQNFSHFLCRGRDSKYRCFPACCRGRRFAGFLAAAEAPVAAHVESAATVVADKSFSVAALGGHGSLLMMVS